MVVTRAGSRATRVVRAAFAGAAIIGAIATCGLVDPAQAATKRAALPPLANAKVIRIGYFANLTHAPALIAKHQRLFQKYLGKTRVEFTIFSVGTAEIEALKGGAIDVGFIGPGPAINGFVTTQGTLLRVVGGATSGGAKFIVKPNLITTAGQPTPLEISKLRGKTIADPGLGGTQDIALRKFLRDHQLLNAAASKVSITPMANADTLAQFQLGKIDGAWVPEPWATRLVQEGKGKVFVDEASLWPHGKFATTVIFAGQKFLQQYPGSVRAVLRANNAAIDYLTDSAHHRSAVNQVQAELLASTGKKLDSAVIETAWPNLDFTNNPLPSTVKRIFRASMQVGTLPSYYSKNLQHLFDLRLLNALQRAAGSKPVTVPQDLK